MAGVGVGQKPARRVEDACLQGHEHVLWVVGLDDIVDLVERLCRVEERAEPLVQEGAAHGHEERRAHALAGDVGEHEKDPAVGQRGKVVEVAAHLARHVREGEGLEAVADKLGRRGDQTELDALGDRELGLRRRALVGHGLDACDVVADVCRHLSVGVGYLAYLVVVANLKGLHVSGATLHEAPHASRQLAQGVAHVPLE